MSRKIELCITAILILGIVAVITGADDWIPGGRLLFVILFLPVLYLVYRSNRLNLARLEAEQKRASDERRHAEQLAALHAKAMESLAFAESSKAKLDAVIQASPLAILSVDPQGNVTSWNSRAEAMFGWTFAEVKGKPLPFTGARSEELVGRIMERTSAQDSLSGLEVTQIRKDGSSFEAAFWSAPLQVSSDPVSGVVVTVADVSEHKRLESQLRLSQKMEAVGRLAGGVAHDFNNLLTVINGYSAILTDSIKDPYARSQAEDILKAGTRAATLVSQLLSFSRHQVSKPQPVDLNKLVRDVERMLLRLIGEHIDLRTSLDANAGWILANPHQIETALINLATNARDAMPDGGALSMETSRVDVRPGGARFEPNLPPGAYTCLTVRDTGHGMDSETQQHVFEPFFTTKEAGKGTGLGLSSVYAAVQKYGGRIFVKSTVGVGTTFSIYLPRCEADLAQKGQHSVPDELKHGNESILLVEDEIAVRRIAREVLSRAGYRVCEAGNGAEAMANWGAQLDQFDLLVTDVVMPLMDGVKLAEEARRRCPRLKIIFMSGHAQEMLSGRDLNPDPASEFLPKPFHPDMLAHKVRTLLDRRAAGAAGATGAAGA